MTKHPVKRAGRAIRNVDNDAIEVIEPAPKPNPFFSFRYSYTEITAQGGKAHLKSKQIRAENGKLTCEVIEGDVDRTVYGQMVRDAQRYYLAHTGLFMKSLVSLLTFGRSSRSDRD